ncbi:hypothetical protein MACJ_003679 [Theileria orientalis]|uniref:ABC transporter n=1 Tax=Theileria orientalis TaxID=68886 RepID=A0A976XKA1_THEOR|nr:hypothetical protein MACJ_003679 [Theileria orientalis]
MNKRSTDRTLIIEDDPESFFWDSQLYRKSDFNDRKNRSYRYYDETSFLKYLFFHWVNKWAFVLSQKYVEPYKLHPLNVSDQILKWEPIFSKHISDGLVRLDLYDSTKSSNKPVRPYKSILLLAIFLTSWKRVFVLFSGLVLGIVLSLSISVLIKKFLEILNDPSIHVDKTILLLLAIMALQILAILFLENINFYICRMIYAFYYLYAIIAYRHALSHRRVYYNNINGSNPLNTCNEVLHTCSPDSPCSKNPLFCPALRYQNKEISPKIFTYVFYDSFYIATALEYIEHVVQFLGNFIYGVYLLSKHAKVNLWVLYIAGALFLFLMVLIEIFNVVLFKFILYMRDYKVTKYNSILGSLSNIKKLFYDDIAANIITQTRNNELSLVFIKILITFVNMSLYSTWINISFYIIKKYFVKSVNDATVVTDIDPAGFMTTFYVYMKIISSMFLIPRAINVIGMGCASFRRLDKFIKDCSPNFYISDNKYTGSVKTSTVIAETTNQLPKDSVVYYKDATFTWVHTRDDLLNKKYEPFLRNVNFELKRGQMAIVTGSKGSGKSNFIKSMLGEMTLVGGSMAVVPLHTSMPIFYASQDIFLQRGTIRSNIVFGHKFDEQLYNAVLKAVELEFDISTWEKGDLRVVSDNALSLSGGQRVRMELARAVYAYLVFHKVNNDYNNSKCSFLMCLDASFHGLDPYVSKTIFNNLFNLKTGLLANDDLSVVLTSSKESLNTCTRSSDQLQFPNSHIYNVKNKELAFSSMLHDFIKNNKHEADEFKCLTSGITGPYTMNILTNDMVGLCLSANSKSVRAEVNKAMYRESFKTYVRDHLAGIRFNPYFVFMKPALFTFSMYIILTVALNALDYIKFILSTNLSDYITENINQYKDGSISTLNFGFLESLAHLNSVIERSISGSQIYRSFNKNSDLIRDFLEQRDYNARTKFLFAAVVSWSTVLFTWMFSITTFIIMVVPIILDKYTKYKMTVGYFGLALSLCTNVIKSYSNFAFVYACAHMLMGSIERFQYFIPPGLKLKFDPSPNTHEEYVVNPSDKDGNFLDKKQLLKRRAFEFKAENKKFYGVRRVFYHPKLTIMNVSSFLNPEHTGVELRDVCVYTTPNHEQESMILKHFSSSANRSEIIGMIGKTGAGKTTLLSVLQNIAENRTGQVLLDGKDLNDIPKVVLRQVIGVLPQLPFVFKGWTVRRFLDPRRLFSDDEINQALNNCGLLKFVNELPGGMKLDTVILPEEPVLYHLKGKGGKSRPRSFEKEGYTSTGYAQPGSETDMLLSNTQIRTLMFARLVLYRHFYRIILIDEPPEEDPLYKESNTHDLEVTIYDLQKHFSHCTSFVAVHDVNVLRRCSYVWALHQGCLMRTCRPSDMRENESIAKIIEECVNHLN